MNSINPELIGKLLTVSYKFRKRPEWNNTVTAKLVGDTSTSLFLEVSNGNLMTIGKRFVHEILGHPDGVGLLNGRYPEFFWDGKFVLLPNGEALDFQEVPLMEVRP